MPSEDGCYIFMSSYILVFFFPLLLAPRIISNISPSNWQNSFEYVMFFISVVPVLAAEIVELFVATKLLFRRNEQNVKFLRNTLIALAASSVLISTLS